MHTFVCLKPGRPELDPHPLILSVRQAAYPHWPSIIGLACSRTIPLVWIAGQQQPVVVGGVLASVGATVAA